MAQRLIMALTIIGITFTLHSMQPQPELLDLSAVELGEPTNPTDSVRYCTELIQQQLPFRQDTSTIVAWLQREHPTGFNYLCQGNANGQTLPTQVLRYVIAYEHAQSHSLARWRKFLAVYGGSVTLGAIGLMGVLIKLSTSC